jgi:hypothetical protein
MSVHRPFTSSDLSLRPLKYLPLLLFLGLSACSDPKPSDSQNNSSALDAAREVVASVTKGIQVDHEVTARAADGIPGILVKFGETEPDYDSLVESISENEAVKSFEGELRIWFETQTEPADRTKDPPFLGSFLTTRTYDAKTGQRIR